MAVFRITSFTKNPKLAKKTIRYITHRRGMDGKTVTRPLFGREGGTEKEEAYEKIDKALRGTTFFRMIISPDPLTEDTLQDLDLREIMDQTMLELQKKFPKQQLEYFAAIHADHTDKRHVHVVALLRGRLTKGHLRALRAKATQEALSQRRNLDRELGITRDHGATRKQRFTREPVITTKQGITQGQQPPVGMVVQRRDRGTIPVFVRRQPIRVDAPAQQSLPVSASTSVSQWRQPAAERLELNTPQCPVCKGQNMVRDGSRHRCITCGLSVEASRSITARLRARQYAREIFLEEGDTL
jgi:hypothetical protein